LDALVAELPRAALAALAGHKQVDFVEEGVERRPLRARGGVAALPGSPQAAPYGVSMVQADKVSDSQAGNRTLCIIDSGIDGTHEDLSAIPMTGENFTTSGAWNTDENSHGTHVAGIVAALNNAVGVVGVAPSGKLRLHIAKVFDAAGSASSVVIARAMLSCWRRVAQVVSMSLGGGSISPMEKRVATLLSMKGVLQIAAAGNDGDATVSYPAGFPEVMSAVASFSQFNADVEIAAPGVAVQSTVPAFSQTAGTLAAGGAGFPVVPMEGSPRVAASGPLADFGLGTAAVAGSMSGKVCLIQRGSISFAAKVVNCLSAVAAVVWSLHTGCTAEQVRASLNKSAFDLGAAGRDVHFGHGLVQAKAAHDRIASRGCGN